MIIKYLKIEPINTFSACCEFLTYLLLPTYFVGGYGPGGYGTGTGGPGGLSDES